MGGTPEAHHVKTRTILIDGVGASPCPSMAFSSPVPAAGKTTLPNRILTHEHSFKVAVIVNEFGEVGVGGSGPWMCRRGDGRPSDPERASGPSNRRRISTSASHWAWRGPAVSEPAATFRSMPPSRPALAVAVPSWVCWVQASPTCPPDPAWSSSRPRDSCWHGWGRLRSLSLERVSDAAARAGNSWPSAGQGEG